jgi:hypothetical protein
VRWVSLKNEENGRIGTKKVDEFKILAGYNEYSCLIDGIRYIRGTKPFVFSKQTSSFQS